MHQNKGFSLVELLVSVGILGVLAAVSLANFENYRGNATKARALSEARGAVTGFQAWLLDITANFNCTNNNYNGANDTGCDAKLNQYGIRYTKDLITKLYIYSGPRGGAKQKPYLWAYFYTVNDQRILTDSQKAHVSAGAICHQGPIYIQDNDGTRLSFGGSCSY